MQIAGYAAVFDVHDYHGDILRPGAFGAPDFARVPLLWEHDAHLPAGVIECGKQDDHGLWIRARLIGVIVPMGHGLSIGFRAKGFKKGPRRELIRVELVEISLVKSPMNPLARVNWVDP